MPNRGSRGSSFTVPVQDVLLRVTASDELYEEARAAGMHFYEQVQAYAARNPLFRTSKRRLFVTEDAPLAIREMAEGAALAGVGPMYTFHGALAEFVGRALLPEAHQITVGNDGHYFVAARRRSRLSVHADTGDPEEATLGVIVRPELGPHGIYTSLGRGRSGGSRDGLVVVATTCILADAAATAGRAILAKTGSLRDALGYLQGIEGVHGALVIRGRDIGVAGGLELAA